MTKPRCRYCGKTIAKRVEHVWLRTKAYVEKYPDVSTRDCIIVDELPSTIADCRKLTNQTVLSVSRDRHGRNIDSFNVWDGQSYVNEFFCNSTHARAMGYLAAQRGLQTKAYVEAVAND